MNTSVMFFMAFFPFHSCSGGLTMTFKSEQASRSDLQNVVTVKYERPANITCWMTSSKLSAWTPTASALMGARLCRCHWRATHAWKRFYDVYFGGRACANWSWVSVSDPGGRGGVTPLGHLFSTQVLHWPCCVVIVCVTWFIAVEVL